MLLPKFKNSYFKRGSKWPLILWLSPPLPLARNRPGGTSISKKSSNFLGGGNGLNIPGEIFSWKKNRKFSLLHQILLFKKFPKSQIFLKNFFFFKLLPLLKSSYTTRYSIKLSRKDGLPMKKINNLRKQWHFALNFLEVAPNLQPLIFFRS